MKYDDNYLGFELGPIRPPSEADSLLLRVTRNCPWNKCKFCGLYKGKQFSIRPLGHIIKDIDIMLNFSDDIQRIKAQSTNNNDHALKVYNSALPINEQLAFQSACRWFQTGMKSVFLQDADVMTVKPDDLVKLLRHIRKSFPTVERITTYARSRSIVRISDEEMARITDAGLNRIHVGMESASDDVLCFINKGVDKKTHIIAGQKVKRAGMELSEYFMPGLGGRQHSIANACETADAMNQINPDFIRIRTVAIPDNTDLFRDWQDGVFARNGDAKIAEELLLFLNNLKGISSFVKSDHILNLLQEVEGRLPDDFERMTAPIRDFLALVPDEQMMYIVGRRTGIFSILEDMKNPQLRKQAENIRESYRITLDNVDDFAAAMLKRFI